MQLFQSWKDSLKFFKPQNFKLFGLLALNTMVKTLGVWLRLFWPLFVFSFLADYAYHWTRYLAWPLHLVVIFVSMVSKFLLFVTLFLSLRPSVKKKTYDYFCDYRAHVAVCALFIFAIFAKNILFELLTYYSTLSGEIFILEHFVSPLVVIPATIFFLFYFDSRGSLKDFLWSVIRWFKMVWYGLPFFFVLVWGLWITYFLMGYFFFFMAYLFMRFLPGTVFIFFVIQLSQFFQTLFSQFFMILAVIPASFAANFYTKRLHDQYKEYFN